MTNQEWLGVYLGVGLATFGMRMMWSAEDFDESLAVSVLWPIAFLVCLVTETLKALRDVL